LQKARRWCSSIKGEKKKNPTAPEVTELKRVQAIKMVGVTVTTYKRHNYLYRCTLKTLLHHVAKHCMPYVFMRQRTANNLQTTELL